MPRSTPKLPRQRGRDLCHLAFRQTLDLLRVTDAALGELCHECPRVPDLDTLVLKTLNEMALAGGEADPRSPTHAFLVHGTDPRYTGTVYGFGPQGYEPVGPAFRFAASESHAFSAGSDAVVICNGEDEGVPLEEFQERFHPAVRRALGTPIRNFVTYRIAGDRPGTIIAFNYPGRATRYEGQVLSALAITLGALGTLSSRIAQVEEAFLYLVGALARASEVNDEVTGDHILRVSRYAAALARAAGWSDDDARVIAYSAELHDVGKIHSPRELLRKPGPLTPDETTLMRQHTLQGERIIGSAHRLNVARRIAGAHHENWDGSGYPRGLAGEAIPREARLARVVDVYDALRCERPYKRALTHDEACSIMLQGDDRTHPERDFDPQLLDTFRRVETEFRHIHAEFQGWR